MWKRDNVTGQNGIKIMSKRVYFYSKNSEKWFQRIMHLCKNGREINITKYGELFIVQKALKSMHLKIVNFYRQTD